MRLKLDSVTHARSSTQDGVRTKLALRFQLLDPLDREEAFALVGQTLEAQFERVQKSLPGMVPQVEERTNGHVEEDDAGVPAAGRRRRGTRSSEHD